MFSLIEKIKNGKLWKFHGGIHPSIKKSTKKIDCLENAQLPNELVIPVLQHIGEQGELLVSIGDQVLKGQALTQSNDSMSPPVHASSSGQISMIEKRPSMHPAVIDELSVVIKPDGLDTAIATAADSRLKDLDSSTILEKIHQAGISGMGGAGFPTAVKATLNNKPINFLIINGAECEPFIQADDALMQVKAKEIIKGIDVLAKLLKPKLVLIAIEDDKKDAISAINDVINDNIQLKVIPTLYPSGGERQLIKILTGMEVPSGGLPEDIGVIVHNVGTCYAIKRAVINNEALTERVVTLAGEGFTEAKNLMVKIGTPVHNLLKSYSKGITASRSKLVVGGPMMGFTLPHAQIPVTKTCNAILLDSNENLIHSQTPQPCIRCGQCADACPSHLLPQSMYWHAKAGELDKTQQLNVMDCIECGACDYVCPSKIPLALYFRQAKAQLRQQQQDAQAASIAKSRFDFREMRLEREKQERAAKHKAAAEKRLAMMDAQKQQASNTDKADPVAAAIARAKAKKNATLTGNNQATTELSNELSKEQAEQRAQQRAERKAQARQYKTEKQAHEKSEISEPEPTATAEKTTNPAIAAAIARAKAKKTAQSETHQEAVKKTQETLNEEQFESTNSSDKDNETKQNPAVAAAIARAKQKKQAQQSELQKQQDSTPSTAKQNPAVAAAIARAKQKKQAQQSELQQQQDSTPSAAKQNPAVAAAIARAKAKKAAQNKDKE